MKSLWILFVIASMTAAACAQAPVSPAGHWDGEIALPGTKLAIRVDLEKAADVWTGTIDIPVQGLRGFKLGAVAVEGASVRFVLPDIPGNPAFAGTLGEGGKQITGDFTQAGLKFPFTLTAKERPAAAAGETPAKGMPGRGLAGFWQGSLRPVPAMELRLALEFNVRPGGALEGVMISLDQGSARIPLTVSDQAGKVRLEVASVGGIFDGAFSADGSEISGEWQQAGQKSPLVFRRLAQAAGLKRPQEPKRPYPYTDEEVVVENKTAGVKLAGTFTVPRGPGPHPAVALITGSGPQDRDEMVMGQRPFLVLADHLTRAGIAVLRYDDRGVGLSTGDFSQATHEDFVGDALAAVAWLKTRPDIDPKRIGLIGHSEGGLVAPLAAIRQPGDIAFLVLLAGVGVPMQDLLIRQSTDMARVMGASEESIAKSVVALRKAYSLLTQAADSAAAEKLMRTVIERQMSDYTAEQRAAMGVTDAMLDSQAKMAATPWFRKLIAYDPRPTLREVKCPVLAINGEKDIQVAAKENLAGIREALSAGGNAQVQTIEFPGLNHLFQTCTTGAVSEYGQIEETFAPIALKAISDWIRERSGR